MRRTEFAATGSTVATNVPDLMAALKEAEIRVRIQQARERAGINQDVLADLLGVSKRAMQNYEAHSGKDARVPWGHLNKIADVTGESVKWILHGDDEEAAQLLERLDEFERQQAEIKQGLGELVAHRRETLEAVSRSALVNMAPEDAADLLRSLQEMLDQWGRDRIAKNQLAKQRRRAGRATDRSVPQDEVAA